MNHPEFMQVLVKDRQDTLRREADQHRLGREATSMPRQTPRDRFRIRDLRWTFLRPAPA